MPNQRKKGKIKATFWLTERQRNKLKALAEDAGLNMTDMFKEMLEAYAQVRNIKLDLSDIEKVVQKRGKENISK